LKALEEPKTKVDQKDTEGVSALMHAAMGGHIQVVRFLVDKGSRISAKDDTGETALMKACKFGCLDVIQYLIEYQMNQKKKGGPLGGGGDPKAQSEIEKKRLLDAKDDEGVTALMKAAEQHDAEVVKLLLDERASVDQKDSEGWNVLMWAALAGEIDIVETLIRDYDQQADYTTDKGENALMKAAAVGHWEVCAHLLEKGAKINSQDNEAQTALMWAAAEGRLACVKNLIEHSEGAKPDLSTKLGKTALLLAAQFGKEEVCKLLIQHGAKVDMQDLDGQTALFGAVQAGNRTLVTTLINKKCPLEAHTKRGETALMWAAMQQQLQCVHALLDANALIHTQDENGQKALDHAEGTLNSHVVEVLREASKRTPNPEEHA